MAGNEKIIVELILKDKDFQKGIKDAVKDTQHLGRSGKSAGNMMATGFKVAAGAIAAIGLTSLIKDLARTAATAQSVESAFKNSFDPSVLNAMKEAVNGTVSEVSLMQKALNAKNLRIPIETLNAGLRLARQRAAETGESVEFLAQSVVLGLGRESALILDNLGISAKRLSDETQRTGNFMAAAAKIINTELENAPDTVSDLADSFAQTQAKVEDLKTEIAKQLLPAFVSFGEEVVKWLGRIEKLGEGKTLDEIIAGEELEKKLKLATEGIKDIEQALETSRKKESMLERLIARELRSNEEIGRQIVNQKDGLQDKLNLQKAITKELVDQVQAQSLSLIEEEKRRKLNMMNVPSVAPRRATTVSGTFQREPVSPESISKGLEEINKSTMRSVEAFQLAKFESMAFTQDLTNGLFDAAIAGETFNETMSKFIQNLILQFAKLITQALVFQAIMSATGGAGVGASSLFGAFFGIRDNASGTNMFGGGLTLVGEYGPELVSLPGGSSIASASKTAGMMGGGELYSKISGEDIYLSSKRYAVNRQR